MDSMAWACVSDIWSAAAFGSLPLAVMAFRDDAVRDSINFEADSAVIHTSAVLSLPYILYAYIWFFPQGWCNLCKYPPLSALGNTPVVVFAVMCPVFKVVQVIALMAWALQAHGMLMAPDGSLNTLAVLGDNTMTILGSTPMYIKYIFVGLFSVSQVFNGAIYQQIGNDGVYYGFKLGYPVPWCSGFPFNIGLRHPQYFGAVIGFWGLLLLVVSDTTLKMGLVPLAMSITAQYTLVSAMEQTGDSTAKALNPVKNE